MNWRSVRGRLDRLERAGPVDGRGRPPPGLWEVMSGASPLDGAHPETRRLVMSMSRELGDGPPEDDGPDYFDRLIDELVARDRPAS